jgi:hypothetical protein
MQALVGLWSLDGRSFYLLNQAFMIVLRKENASEVEHFWSTSLIHSFSKLFAKILSSRLAPHMNALVMPNQSAFSHGRAIHDNFRVVHAAAKLLHTCRHLCTLLKVDIAKAFDTVAWYFLLAMLRHMGFSRSWINWISLRLSMASTKILING